MAVTDRTAEGQPASVDIEEEEEEQDGPLDRFGLDEDKRKAILEQIETEWQISWKHMQPKRAVWYKRLKLYNNQRRDDDKVGDNTLFVVFNTILAALYEDLLSAIWKGREEGDDDVAENLNGLAKFDHAVMEKDELDYFWIWDTCFFGRGYVILNDFDRTPGYMAPAPENADPLTMLRDPDASSSNGNSRGHGASRFWGQEVGMTKWQMKAHPDFHNIKGVKKDKSTKSLRDDASAAREEASGRQTSKYDRESLGENYEYDLLRWFTHIDGEKHLIVLANKRKHIVRFRKLKNQDYWPIIDRVLFPVSNDFDGVSIPDLIEDKQRARAVMINLGMKMAIADLYPMYLFNKKKITNPNDLNYDFNKFIPVKGNVEGAVQVLQKARFGQQVNFILNILDVAAQKAVAAPEIAQGIQPSQSRTLGETQLIAQGKDVRHSLAARIFGWSEKRFWQMWYRLYKENFKDADEKSIRISGPLSAKWRKLTRENIITTSIDPDVSIEVASVAEALRRKKFQEFSVYIQLAGQDPRMNRPYGFRKLGKIMNMSKEELTFLFPPNIHELSAEDENELLNDNKLPVVDQIDDDIIHIEIHNKAKSGKAKTAHIEGHKEMMKFKLRRPDLFPQPEFSPLQPVTSNTPAEQPGRQLPEQQKVPAEPEFDQPAET